MRAVELVERKDQQPERDNRRYYQRVPTQAECPYDLPISFHTERPFIRQQDKTQDISQAESGYQGQNITPQQRGSNQEMTMASI